MTLAERQEVAKQIVHFYAKIANFNKYETVSHFKKQGFKSRRLYYILRCYDDSGTHEFKRKFGPKPKVATPEMTRKVQNLLVNTSNTIRDTAKALGIPKSTVFDIKRKLGINTKKCKKHPKYTQKQEYITRKVFKNA